MAGESLMTTDHDAIRQWVEQRGGRPAQVRTTGTADDPGLLRIDFPDYGDDEALEEISWDAFFEAFDENNLAMMYQETTQDGSESRFSKFVSRDTAHQASG